MVLSSPMVHLAALVLFLIVVHLFLLELSPFGVHSFDLLLSLRVVHSLDVMLSFWGVYYIQPRQSPVMPLKRLMRCLLEQRYVRSLLFFLPLRGAA